MVIQIEWPQEVTSMLAELPPLRVESMTQVQLTEVIPNLVQLSTGRDLPLFGENQFRPDWWPSEIPWLDPGLEENPEDQLELLRTVVRSCYRHLGQENLLNDSNLQITDTMATEKEGKFQMEIQQKKPPGGVAEAPPPGDTAEAQASPPGDTAEAPPTQKSESNAGPSVSDAPIWICFLCTKQFSNQVVLMEHQEVCEKEAEIHEARQRILEIQQQQNLIMKLNSQDKRNFLRLHKRKRKIQYTDINRRPEKSVFIGLLDLVKKPDLEKAVEASPKKEVDSDCEIIEVSFPEAPRTPRTPKSLMSQLSRDTDAQSRRRHLSFSGMFSDSESGEELEKKISKSSLLFGIDITSSLGHRVKKHLKIDTTIPVVKDYEQYCVGPNKNKFMEKLRSERTYPIVYKKRKKFSAKYTHTFKFNSNQRREFMITKKTGLTKRSRNLLGLLKDCSVKLKRLKPEVIQEWCRPKPKPMPKPKPTFVPQFSLNNHTTTRVDSHLRQILSKPLYGPKSARIKQINENINRIRSSQSMQHYNMITKVVTNPDGTETMKVIYVPKKLPERKRKQTFSPYKKVVEEDDDDIQIIELSDSSDDETNSTKLTESPRKCPPQMNRTAKSSTPQSRTGILKPTSMSSENLVGRNSPIMKNNQFKPRTGVITMMGIKYDSPSGVQVGGVKKRYPTPPGSPASQNISFGQVGLPSGLRISNVRSLATTNPITANKVTPTPILEQYSRAQSGVKTVRMESGKPNILQRPTIAIAPLKLVSNKPEEAIVIDDED
ncbi:uncharacterized protein LOC125654844 isoform X2 [Ostrea edulis]|uniref:uncharacterized protein LOC125654844 isoform X2 n=1 Tax=Ostrea edulis TaxID=37623 RepID=UPI0024AFED32|nr:uncharacterized protein LOC125654844 isoform X2 [Ostrea edulis]